MNHMVETTKGRGAEDYGTLSGLFLKLYWVLTWVGISFKDCQAVCLTHGLPAKFAEENVLSVIIHH